MHNCLSPSNDYTTVAFSNNNQEQLHTHVAVPYWSPNVWLYRPRIASRYSVWTFSYFEQLTSYDNNYVCHECFYVPEVGVATQTFLAALRAPVAEPPFLNFKIRHCNFLLADRYWILVWLVAAVFDRSFDRPESLLQIRPARWASKLENAFRSCEERTERKSRMASDYWWKNWVAFGHNLRKKVGEKAVFLWQLKVMFQQAHAWMWWICKVGCQRKMLLSFIPK